MQNNNAQERDIERRLSGVESPEPPADLLDRLRGDIPEYLQPVPELDSVKVRRTRRYQLAAASVFLAVVGGFLAYRVLQTAPEPASVVMSAPSQEPQDQERQSQQPIKRDAVTTEVGAQSGAREDQDDTTSSLPTDPPTGEGRAVNERLAEQLKSLPAAPFRDAPREEPEPTRLSTQTVPSPEAADSKEGPISSDRQQSLEPPRVAEEITVEAEAPVVHQTSTSAAVTFSGPGRKKLDEVPKPKTRDRRVAAPTMTPPPPVTVAPPPPPPSTGGTAEPNDQPWGDMFFRPYGTNPFVDTEDDAQSTFGLDVDTGSYTLARGYLERGHLPPAEAIRVEEFINFFDYRDPAPRHGEFTLAAEGGPSPWKRGPRYQLLRIGVHGREIPAAQRKDATLVFVVDVSGSMARENRIELVKKALRLLLDQLGDGDRVGLVVYGDRGRVLLEPSGDLQAVRQAIDELATGGSTNAEEGLLLGYQLARRHYRPGSINRLVLCSDGVANVGNTGPEAILERVDREAEEGIELTTVGFGMGNYNDVLMEQLADQGDGNYAYVDTLDEARRIFVENLTGTLQTIASDAKIQVEFDPQVVTRYRLLGYENRDVADHRFRDDTVDAGELGAGHRVTALYEIKLADDAPRRRALAEIHLRYRSRATGQIVEESLELRRDELARSWRAASPSLRLAALAAEVAEVLKRSYWVRDTRPADFLARARRVERDFGGDRDVAELVRLAERIAHLADWREAQP